MSGTPTISEVYAVVGSPHRGPGAGRLDSRLSLVLLARGPWGFRPQAVAEAWDLGFSDIVFVEEGRPRYDTEALARRFPGVRFLIPGAPMNPGSRINAAAREVFGDRFLVLWDDQTLPETGLPLRVARLWVEADRLALVPEFRDRSGRDLPSVQVPGLEKDRLKILSLGADEDSVDTLFPQDYTALYDRRRFLRTGGYDPTLTNPFWQKADWGLRSRLWGESLTVERGFRIDYRSSQPSEDQTPDQSYPRFYLRNLAVRHAGDHGILPASRFWSHARRSGRSFFAALGSFLEERRWVHTHRYRFQTDARLLAELWGDR